MNLNVIRRETLRNIALPYASGFFLFLSCFFALSRHLAMDAWRSSLFDCKPHVYGKEQILMQANIELL
jgi:hypothetical protein